MLKVAPCLPGFFIVLTGIISPYNAATCGGGNGTIIVKLDHVR